MGLPQFFKEYFTKNGGTITGEQSYGAGDKDFKAQLTAHQGRRSPTRSSSPATTTRSA